MRLCKHGRYQSAMCLSVTKIPESLNLLTRKIDYIKNGFMRQRSSQVLVVTKLII